MIAPGAAAADLQIDEAVDDPVTAQYLPDDGLQGGTGHRSRNAQGVQGPVQTVEMPLRVHQPAGPHAPDFVDGICELEAAILDMNGCERVTAEASVDVGDPGQDGFLTS